MTSRSAIASRGAVISCSARSSRDPPDQLAVELAADHGGDPQRLVRLLAEPVEAAADHLADALRDLQLGGAAAAGRAGPRWPAAGPPRRRRTGCRRSARGPPRPGPAAAGDAGGHLDVARDRRRPEAAQRDPAAALDPGQLAEHPGERVVAAELDVAVGAEDQQAARGELAGDELEQQQRGLVGPVQVVEHEHHRAGRGRPPSEEARDRVEEPEARLLAVGALGGLDVEPLGDLGDELGDLGGAGAELPGERDRVGVADVGRGSPGPRASRRARPRPRGSGPSRRARR